MQNVTPGRRPRHRGTAFLLWLTAATTCVLLVAPATASDPDPALPVVFQCRAAQVGALPETAGFCAEIRQHLAAAFPDRIFLADPPGKPASGQPRLPMMELRLAHPSRQTLGLAVVWQFADGRRHAGQTLSTTIFDSPLGPKLRRRFWAHFFQINPLPF